MKRRLCALLLSVVLALSLLPASALAADDAFSIGDTIVVGKGSGADYETLPAAPEGAVWEETDREFICSNGHTEHSMENGCYTKYTGDRYSYSELFDRYYESDWGEYGFVNGEYEKLIFSGNGIKKTYYYLSCTSALHVHTEDCYNIAYELIDASAVMLSFDSNTTASVSGMPAGIRAVPDASISIPDGVPTRSGYVFVAWNTEKDGSGTAYASGAAITVPAEDKVLYAIWNQTNATKDKAAFGWNVASNIVNTKATRFADQDAYDIAAENIKVYLGNVTGTGQGGVITEQDVQTALAGQQIVEIPIGGFGTPDITDSGVTVGEVEAKGIIIVAQKGITVSHTALCCNDGSGYSCSTASSGNAGTFDSVGTDVQILQITPTQFAVKEYFHAGAARWQTWLMISVAGNAQHSVFYRVSYDNGENWTLVNTAAVDVDAAIPEYSYSETGYETISIWYTGTDCSAVWTKPDKMPNNDIIVYAKMKAIPCTITYSWSGLPTDGTKLYQADGTETTPSVPQDSTVYSKNQAYTVDTTYTSSTVVYTHDTYGNPNGKYTFSGWDTEAGTIQSNLTIAGTWTYAPVSVSNYALRYVLNGGEILAGADYTAAGSYVAGYPISAPSDAEVERDGFNFLGWYVEEALETPWNGSTMPAADLTLYAKWSSEPIYTIEIPMEKKVEKGGSSQPGKQTFNFEVYTLDYPEESNEPVKHVLTTGVTGASIETSGVNTYPGTVKLTVDEEVFSRLTDGFYLREVDGKASYWTYSDAVYQIVPSLTNDQTVSVEILKEDVPEQTDKEPVPQEKAVFTNTYTYSGGGGSSSWTLTLTKVDSNDNDTTLSGAKFDLYRVGANSDTKVGSYTTNSNGVIQATVRSSGQYYWIETLPPVGYTLDATKHMASTNRTERSIVVENKKTSTPSSLNDADHYAYIVGYPDGLAHPEAEITRAEVATIFFRLLTEDSRSEYLTEENRYSDVGRDSWYNTAVSTLTAIGVIDGQPDGTFAPTRMITRAEFAAIAARFDTSTTETSAAFTDISGHWAESEISKAAASGWINGYTDGTFKPNQYITRAEAMALVNRVLNRNPDTKEDLLPDMIVWPDNTDTAKWYYLDVQEATNSHDYQRRSNGTEDWTAIQKIPDWIQYQ